MPVPYVAIVEGDDVTAKIAEVEEKLTYPVFTKPSNMGSSVGISKSENQKNSVKLWSSPSNMTVVS